MAKYEDDIEEWIKNEYPDVRKAKDIIEPLLGIDTKISHARIIRSILYLSGNDYGSLLSYTNKALNDPRNILWWAEYDNRNVQRRDFNYGLDQQK